MQTIATTTKAAFNTAAARCFAKATGGVRVTIPWVHDLSVEGNHQNACKALCAKLAWRGRVVGGHTPTGMVWVFDSKDSPSMDIADEAPGVVADLLAALEEAVAAAEHVIGVCEADLKAGESSSTTQRSMPHAALAECYATMAFVSNARAAIAKATTIPRDDWRQSARDLFAAVTRILEIPEDKPIHSGLRHVAEVALANAQARHPKERL